MTVQRMIKGLCPSFSYTSGLSDPEIVMSQAKIVYGNTFPKCEEWELPMKLLDIQDTYLGCRIVV